MQITRKMQNAAKGRLRAVASLVAAYLGLGTILLLFFDRALRSGVIDEDAYISFRYARNLLHGDGLVFNAGGERVEGITNLLWTLVVAAGSWLSGFELPDIASALGIFFGASTLLVVYRWSYEKLYTGSLFGMSRTRAAWISLAAPALLVAVPGFAFYSASGLEVPLFAFLATGGLYSVGRGKKLGTVALGSVLLGAAAITRPGGALILVFGAVACLWAPGNSRNSRVRRFKRFKSFLAGSVPGFAVLAGVTLWRLFYYGSPVPNTAFAKAGGLESAWNWGLPYVAGAALSNLFPVLWILALGGVLVTMYFFQPPERLSARASASSSFAILALVPVWCAYVVYVGGDYMPFYRFMLPMLPILCALAVPGLVGLLSAAKRLLSLSRIKGTVAFTAAGLSVALLAVFVVGQVPGTLETEQNRKQAMEQDAERRRTVAAWFEKNAPDALVARSGVGAFGYYSEVRIVDMLGLNSEQVARHGQRDAALTPGHQVGDAGYVLSREPDYMMVSVEPPFRFVTNRELASSPRFFQEYHKVQIDLDNGRKISIWHRESPGEISEGFRTA